jgi:hypothetical protein
MFKINQNRLHVSATKWSSSGLITKVNSHLYALCKVILLFLGHGNTAYVADNNIFKNESKVTFAVEKGLLTNNSGCMAQCTGDSASISKYMTLFCRIY